LSCWGCRSQTCPDRPREPAAVPVRPWHQARQRAADVAIRYK
jgi:hypothetical protein